MPLRELMPAAVLALLDSHYGGRVVSQRDVHASERRHRVIELVARVSQRAPQFQSLGTEPAFLACKVLPLVRPERVKLRLWRCLYVRLQSVDGEDSCRQPRVGEVPL